MTDTSAKCEFCQETIQGEHYSLPDCNETGIGVQLHEHCRIASQLTFSIPAVCIHVSRWTADFPRRFGRRVKAAGGKYSSTQGDASTRYVDLPLPGNEELFREIVSAAQDASGQKSPKIVVVARVEHNIRLRARPKEAPMLYSGVTVHKVSGLNPGETLHRDVRLALWRMCRIHGAESITFAGSPDHAACVKAVRIEALKRQIDSARDTIAYAEAQITAAYDELATLYAEKTSEG